MPHTPNLNNFRTSSGTSLANLNLGWITKEYLMSVYPQIANQITTPELWVWGSNYSRQLGIGNNVSKSTPVTTFAGGANWKQVSSGYRHVMAVKTDGTLWGWGAENNLLAGGNLGTNAPSSFDVIRCTPVTTFAGGTDWKQVSCGGNHTAAVKTDGTLWLWGNNYQRQLGTNSSNLEILTPVTTFAGGTDWKQVSCGAFEYTATFTAAIKTDGTLWTWGLNYNYASQSQPLGINVDGFDARRDTPVTTFAGGTNWKQVSCGYNHMSAIKTDGTLWIWGDNAFGQLGTNNTTAALTPVTTFAGGTNWKQVSAGFRSSSAIKTDGTLWVWGSNQNTPITTFAGGTTWKQVAYGSNYIAAIKTDGALWTWGANYSGQLGTNNTTARFTPVTTFAGGTDWKQVSCGGAACAIKSADSI